MANPWGPLELRFIWYNFDKSWKVMWSYAKCWFFPAGWIVKIISHTTISTTSLYPKSTFLSLPSVLSKVPSQYGLGYWYRHQQSPAHCSNVRFLPQLALPGADFPNLPEIELRIVSPNLWIRDDKNMIRGSDHIRPAECSTRSQETTLYTALACARPQPRSLWAVDTELMPMPTRKASTPASWKRWKRIAA